MLTVVIESWNEHHPRGDLKKLTWIKIYTAFRRHKKLTGCDRSTRLLLVDLWCLAGEENKGGVISGPESWFEQELFLDQETLLLGLKDLQTRGLLSINPEGSRTDSIQTWQESDQICTDSIQIRTDPDQICALDKRREEKKREEKTPTQSDHALAQQWADFAKEHSPHLKPKVDDYADAIRKLRALDGVSEDQLVKMLAFAKRDDFWRDNAVSPVSLRTKSKNGHYKWQNLITAMRKGLPTAKRQTASEILEPRERPLL